MKNFWTKLNKPILALAPMAGITDSAFRQICKEYGADVVYSEMASVAALTYNSKATLEMLKFSAKERPYVVQLFGNDPEQFSKAVRLVEKKIKPDGFDINFGCPAPKVLKQKAGAELFADLKKSRAVIESVLANTKLPISIKTRTEAKGVDIYQFLKNISDLNVSAIMIHGRTLAKGFEGPVDWQTIKKVRQDFPGIVLANGGIKNRQDANNLLKKTGADGLGLAQGALGRPWLFAEIRSVNNLPDKDIKEIFSVALAHAKLAKKLKGQQGIIEMRKHLCWYVQGMKNARGLRKELVKVETLTEIKKIFNI